MLGVGLIIAIVALGFVVSDHLTPIAKRVYNVLRQWLAENPARLPEPIQGYVRISLPARLAFSHLQLIAIETQSPHLDLQTLTREILNLHSDRNKYDAPTSHGHPDQLQRLQPGSFRDEYGDLQISWDIPNDLIKGNFELLVRWDILNELIKGNLQLLNKADGCRAAANAGATAGFLECQQRLRSNGNFRTINRVHNLALPESRDEEPQCLRTSPESKFEKVDSELKPTMSVTNPDGPAQKPVSEHQYSSVAAGASKEEEEEGGAAAADSRTKSGGELDMDLTEEGYNSEVLEVIPKEKGTTLRYKGKTKSGRWPIPGAMRGKSTIQIMKRRENNDENVGVRNNSQIVEYRRY